MSERKEEGGPASEKTLREWFAGQALAGYIAMYANPGAFGKPNAAETAKFVYEYADAMLKERSK